MILVNIQPTWLIEENTRIRRVWVWASPNTPPTKTDVRATTVIKLKFSVSEPKIRKGFTFWMVSKIKRADQVTPSATRGSHEWNGAAPNLIIRATISNLVLNLILTKNPTDERSAPSKKRAEAMVWVRK